MGRESGPRGHGKSISWEFAKEAIRINCIAPGYVKTEMTERTNRFLTPEQMEAIEKEHPLGLGEPEDAAFAVAFLLSAAARWITGTTVVVDGGYSA